MKHVLLFSYLMSTIVCFSQNNFLKKKNNDNKKEQVELLKICTIKNKLISAWNIDQLNNVYVAEGSTLNKYNSEGNLIFSQSIKSIGEISSIDILNPMKIGVFSKEQQKICFIDNTLTLINECIDLSTRNLGFVNKIYPSNRQNIIWLWDSNNSKILQIDNLNTKKTIRETSNLNGILNLEKPVFFRELDNQLYVVDLKKNIYVFDVFGSLVPNNYNLNEKEIISSNKNKILSMIDKNLYVHNANQTKKKICKLMDIEALSFEVNSNFLYVETTYGIEIFKFL